MHQRRFFALAVTLATGLAVSLPAVPANAGLARGSFHKTNLVSDIPGLAITTDSNLVNPWGISAGPNTPMWVSDNNAGVTTLYSGSGQKVPLTVKIPQPNGSDGGTPTGTVFSRTNDFNADFFLFATEDGTVAGWKPSDGTRARIEVDRSGIGAGAVYKGLALGANATGAHLYASNFRFGTVDVFNSSFRLVTLAGSFTDPGIPAGFAPFNIQNLGGVLFVTYALQNAAKHDDVAGPGNGFVDAFDLNGTLLRRVASGATLNSPGASRSPRQASVTSAVTCSWGTSATDASTRSPFRGGCAASSRAKVRQPSRSMGCGGSSSGAAPVPVVPATRCSLPLASTASRTGFSGRSTPSTKPSSRAGAADRPPQPSSTSSSSRHGATQAS